MFKVLVIAYYFPPMGLSGVQRTLKFTKYMKEFNWEPTVITAGKTGYFAHDKSLMSEAEEAGIRIIRTDGRNPNSILAKFGTIKIPRESIRKILNRISQTIFIPDNKLSWSKKALKKAEELLSQENFDAVFVTIPPFSAFYEIAKLKEKFDVPIFADYRDLWYGSHLIFYATPFHRTMHKRMEYSALKAADRIIVNNRKIKEKLVNQYQFLTFEDIFIIPHGFDQTDFDSVPQDPAPKNKMILTYSGIFYEHYSPEYIFKAFKKILFERPDIGENIELHFVGYLGKTYEKLVKKMKLEPYVVNHGYLDHKEAVRKIKSSHVLWMMLGNWKNKEAILPGKIFEYFGSRKPLICCVPEGTAKNAIKEYGAAFITDPFNVDQIKKTIIEVHEKHMKNELPVPNEEFVKRHDRKILTEQLVKQFQFFLKA